MAGSRESIQTVPFLLVTSGCCTFPRRVVSVGASSGRAGRRPAGKSSMSPFARFVPVSLQLSQLGE
jgi:hypothetical protein